MIQGLSIKCLQEKRQTQFHDIATRSGPNNEVIVTCDDDDVVFARGNNARTVPVGPAQFVKSGFSIVSICETDGAGNEIEVQTFTDIYQYTRKRCNPPPGDRILGPGTLYLSDGQALYLNDGCAVENNIIRQAVDNAPEPIVTIEVEAAVDGGNMVSNLVLNEGEFEFIVTGSTSMRIGPGETVSYAGGTITSRGQTFSGINEFAVVERGLDGNAQFSRFDSSSAPISVPGPGQLYVGSDNAVFLGDLGEGTTAPGDVVNQQVVSMTFMFSSVSGTSMTLVVDRENNPITVISPNTMSVEIAGASTATYGGMEVTITTSGGQVFDFNGISRFSVFDDNDITINPSTFDFSSGGTMFVDSTENTAVFTSNSNPAAAEAFQSFIPGAEEASYTVGTDSDGVRILMRTTGSPPDTETDMIQTITGSFVTNVGNLETVVYENNEIQIQSFDGTPVVRIGEVDNLFINTVTNPSGNFSTSAPTPFSGPGTISYSRGTGFYTTDRELGGTIDYQSRTAPIPRIDFEVSPIDINNIDGVNYTVSTVTQSIGGDRVINYEAQSYITSPEQEVLYANDVVSVHTPIVTADEPVTFDGGAQEVTYTDTNGDEVTLTGVTTFNQFSGGDITTTSTPDSATAQGPGKLYVSEDGMTVTFSNSDIITPEIANLIRLEPADFEVGADQFSSIYTGVFNLSTDSATVTYPGGGVIYYSSFNGSRDALYVDDEGVSNRIQQAVSSLLTITKSAPAKDDGIIRLIFNGKEVFPYSPVPGNNEFLLSSGGSFDYINEALSGSSLPGGPYTGYSMITVFDGVEVKQVNSSSELQTFQGPGLLLLPQNSDKALYTTSPSAISYLSQSIQNVRNFLSPPRIRPGEGSITTKNRFDMAVFGEDVTVFEDADLTFECNVEAGRPEPSVAFYRVFPDGTEIMLNDTMDEIVIANNTLTLLNIRMDDAGEYECRASNGVPEDAMASSTLRVREAGEYSIKTLASIIILRVLLQMRPVSDSSTLIK